MCRSHRNCSTDSNQTWPNYREHYSGFIIIVVLVIESVVGLNSSNSIDNGSRVVLAEVVGVIVVILEVVLISLKNRKANDTSKIKLSIVAYQKLL